MTMFRIALLILLGLPALAQAAPPESGFTYASRGYTISFTNTSADPDADIVAYYWNFGDGTISRLRNPITTYVQRGSFTVSLRVTDASGNTDTFISKVFVSDPRLVPNDYGGDAFHRSDVLWRNVSTGANHIWDSGLLARGRWMNSMHLSWRPVGSGSFGRFQFYTDILWRNDVTGENLIWRGYDYSIPVAAMPDLAWQVAGIGDFNDDQQSDILWHHAVSGASEVWYSADSARRQVLTTVTDTAWKIVGVGDFNGDFFADILWRHDGGANAIWLSGNYATQQPVVGVTNPDWEVAGIGYFNNGFKADLIWRNRRTGANALWWSADYHQQPPMTGITNTDWTLACVADYDGDRRSDLLWHNQVTGESVIWWYGLYEDQEALVTVPDTNWKIIP